jgi:putative phage-type endonuclease
MTTFHPATKEEWLELRHKYVSSTEASALFGLSPYTTKFELFHVKRDPKPSKFEASERMKWGLRMEEAIARAIADEYGVKVRKLNAYVSKEETGLGASFDYEIVGIKDDANPEDKVLQEMYRDLGPGILEIKNVDWLVWKRSWATDEGSMEAPAHIEVQVQAQLHTIERSWAAIGVLVGGNSLRLLVRERDPVVGENLDRASALFWREVKANRPPPVMMPQDAELVAYLYNYAEPGKVLDAQGDSEEAQKIASLVRDYHDQGILKSAAENKQKAIKAELLTLIGDAERVVCPDGYSISAGVVAEAVIPAYTRKAYRNVRISKKESKRE